MKTNLLFKYLTISLVCIFLSYLLFYFVFSPLFYGYRIEFGVGERSKKYFKKHVLELMDSQFGGSYIRDDNKIHNIIIHKGVEETTYFTIWDLGENAVNLQFNDIIISQNLNYHENSFKGNQTLNVGTNEEITITDGFSFTSFINVDIPTEVKQLQKKNYFGFIGQPYFINLINERKYLQVAFKYENPQNNVVFLFVSGRKNFHLVSIHSNNSTVTEEEINFLALEKF